ncbi:uncharacterized protein LOC126249521 isoform X2 [Schistocerca nitens]|uniref:uncharacterized protein LOC126249521 isoform X2 n=1 Tax=Schistocerca nitens TaxID=7011 RepID=UPI002118E633|nr:uncharacterized protein LOC126249521 isoform X2 [Schistocerca nitens]
MQVADCARACALLLLLAWSDFWRPAYGTCVFQSDFGFNVSCAFKKSGLFRVRNLGGVKGYVDLGFSVGDDLGFSQSLSALEANRRRSVAGRSTNVARNGVVVPGGVIPPFKPIAPARNVSRPSRLAPGAAAGVVGLPVFQALPASITRAAAPAAVAHPLPLPAPQALRNALNNANNHFQVRKDLVSDNGISSNTLSLRTLASQQPTAASAQGVSLQQLVTPPQPALVRAIAQATNLSTETVAAAIAIRQQQLLQAAMATSTTSSTTTTTTTTTTTRRPPPADPPKKYSLAGLSKVMNAPKEYYPVGYEKNFDDNFASRVELPDTSFYCGDQKHFPGLYADEDLGCMVFHVCAFTDDGLIMKSFLCPESTLFDQNILKCNWWFYVDCRASSKLYDSNIPISKSYQLMKALAFFSSYNKS